MTDSDPKHPPSPCVSVCAINPATGLCRGCMRSLDEIAAWPRMTADQKHDVLRELRRRKRAGE